MRKKIIILFIVILLGLVGLFIFIKPKEEKIECKIDFNKVLNDVNEFYSNEFEPLDLSFEKPNILVNITNTEDVLYAISYKDINEYFVILKDLSEEEISLLEEEIKLQKELSNEYFMDSEIITKSNYTYLVVSLEKNSIIKGIINSNIYCENN